MGKISNSKFLYFISCLWPVFTIFNDIKFQYKFFVWYFRREMREFGEFLHHDFFFNFEIFSTFLRVFLKLFFSPKFPWVFLNLGNPRISQMKQLKYRLMRFIDSQNFLNFLFWCSKKVEIFYNPNIKRLSLKSINSLANFPNDLYDEFILKVFNNC